MKSLAAEAVLRLFSIEDLVLLTDGTFGQWNCLDRPVTEQNARAGHYLAHNQHPTIPPCPQSRKEASAYNYKRRHGTLEGWKYIPLEERKAFNYDCSDGPVTEETANHRHYDLHLKREGKAGICHQSRKELSAYRWLRKYGTLDGWLYVPLGRGWSCLDGPVTEENATAGHYQFHTKCRNEKACPQSYKEASAYYYLMKHGTLEGWCYYPLDDRSDEAVAHRRRSWLLANRYDPDEVFDCSDRPVTETNIGRRHYYFHRNEPGGGVPCPQSRKELSAERWLRLYGTLESWEHRPLTDWDCDNDDTDYAGRGHIGFHQRRNERACLPSRNANRRYLDMLAAERLPYGLNLSPHTLYVYVFEDGFRYFGITSGPVRERDLQHRLADTLLGTKLRAGHPHTLGEIGTFPNRREAEEAEAFLIETTAGLGGGAGLGWLLNHVFVPRWYRNHVTELVDGVDDANPQVAQMSLLLV